MIGLLIVALIVEPSGHQNRGKSLQQITKKIR